MVARTGNPVLLRIELGAGGGIFDTLHAIQPRRQPRRRITGKARNLQYAACHGRGRRFKVGRDETAVLQPFADAPCGVAVARSFEQHQMAIGCKQRFNCGLPSRIGDLDDFGQHQMRDACFIERAAQGCDVGFQRGLAAA